MVTECDRGGSFGCPKLRPAFTSPASTQRKKPGSNPEPLFFLLPPGRGYIESAEVPQRIGKGQGSKVYTLPIVRRHEVVRAS